MKNRHSFQYLSIYNFKFLNLANNAKLEMIACSKPRVASAGAGMLANCQKLTSIIDMKICALSGVSQIYFWRG